MPQHRTLLHTAPDLRVERVCFHPTPPEWSPTYATETARFVLPIGRTGLDIRAHHNDWLVDGLTAMRLDRQFVYQMRLHRPSARESLVVIGRQTESAGAAPGFWLLSPRALFRAHLVARCADPGPAMALATAALVREIARGAQQPPSSGGAARARRLLVTLPDTFARASLHDLADAAAVSAFHLARSFRRQTGLSVHQYRQRLRLADVLARLSEGERDLAGLAHDHGFCSQSHLGSVFQREVGVTLGQARLALAPQALNTPIHCARI